MSSGRGGGKPFSAVAGNPSFKGKNVADVASPQVEQLAHSVADIKLDSNQDGEWEVYAKKSKNRPGAGSNAAKHWVPSIANTRAWGQTDGTQKPGSHIIGGFGRATMNTWQTQNAGPRRQTGRGIGRPQFNNRSYERNSVVPQPSIPPALEHGWNWRARAGSAPSHGSKEELEQDSVVENDDDDDENDDESDILDDSDDELLSDDFDSDESQKSFETRKQSGWFKKFFASLDNLTVDEINEPARQWHCPACQNGPGAIDWYRGLQPLMTHAKTKGSKRVKLHRELAELLEEELHRRGTSVIPSGEAFGKWKGLKQEEKDHEIVWPPMVVIMNTRLEKDENDKWTGMGSSELLEYFSSYAAVKARHSYGPQGHRGMSLLIFEGTAGGYLEAERLHKHFAEQGTDREAWDRARVLFLPGGKRQLYGFLAVKEDLDIFNQHCQGKSRLKYEMRSYQEMVVNQIRQMSEDNQELIYLKNKVVKEQRHAKALEESFKNVTAKLRMTVEESRIVRQRTKLQHDQYKEEMDFQEEFFRQQLDYIREAREAKEEEFEKLQQQERDKVKQSVETDSSNSEDYRKRAEKIENFIQVQDKEMGDFVAERDKLIQEHEEKMTAMRKRHWEEEVGLEKEFDAELTRLMEKYAPHGSKDATEEL